MKKLLFITLIAGFSLSFFIHSCDSPRNQYLNKRDLKNMNGYIEAMYNVSFLKDDTLVVDGVKYHIPYMNSIPSGTEEDRVDVFIVIDEKPVLLNDKQNNALTIKIRRRLLAAKRKIQKHRKEQKKAIKEFNEKKEKAEQDKINKILGL